jgi:CMP-N,N'-diacetyllegionaminic acid synthase
MSKVRIIALIPARRNSKGILFKNRQMISGISLVEHALNLAKECSFDEIIISTDDEYFLEHEYISKYCHQRDERFSGDEAIVADVVRHYSEDEKRKDDFFVILEPTTFLRNKKHLDFLFDGSFFRENKKTFASFVIAPIVREKMWDFESGKMIPHPNVWRRRQEYRTQYILSGHYYGLYLSQIKHLYPSLCDENLYPLIIEDDIHIDIDSQKDLDIARIILADKLIQ